MEDCLGLPLELPTQQRYLAKNHAGQTREGPHEGAARGTTSRPLQRQQPPRRGTGAGLGVTWPRPGGPVCARARERAPALPQPPQGAGRPPKPASQTHTETLTGSN